MPVSHSPLRWICAAAVIVLVPVFVPEIRLRGEQGPPVAPATKAPVRLTAADAARLAQEARAGVKVEIPEGLELSLWAPDKLVVDPVAIDVDPNGVVYVASTTRNNMPLDIRGHENWMQTVHTLKTTADLRAFYEREMAPERSAQNGWIQDLNGDGSRDIRDLVEMKERLYRLEDTDGDGRADLSRVVFEGFNHDPAWDIAGGLMAVGKDLIVGASPGVYRLHDSNGDGILDRQTTIKDGFNVHPAFGGHVISGVTLGPDGRLYWEVGDIGFHVVEKSGKTWAYPNQGAVLRSEIDGTGFEVFAAGIRNLQEFSFDEHGNLISVDNDGDHQGENERLVYLPFGSDSGWRSTWQYGKYTDPKNNRYNVWMDEGMFKTRHPGQASHIVPPVAPWHAGPSGMVYNPGTALSAAWRNFFFVSSFPGAPGNARIYGFTLAEDGAGFTMSTEKVLLRGILTVGMKIGPDGALYLTDWITGWDSKNNGRLWKIDAPAEAGSAVRKEVQSLLQADLAGRSVPDLSSLLKHADMRVRLRAQFELARRGDVTALVAAARDRSHQLARLHAIWGVAQVARRQPAQGAALVSFLGDDDVEVRAQAAKMIGDVRWAAGKELLPLLADSAPRVRFFAAEALGRLVFKPAAAPLVTMLAANDGKDALLQHAGALALSSIGDAAALEGLSTHTSRGVRTAALVALRRMKNPGVAKFLTDADEAIVVDAARAINDDGSIPAVVPALAALLGKTTSTNEPLLRRALNANLRVGTPEALARVSAFAAQTSAAEKLRVEAVAIMGVWTAPSPHDRVDGSYHTTIDVAPQGTAAVKKPHRDAAAARQAVVTLIDASAAPGATTSAEMKSALAEAAGRLDAKAAAPALLAQLMGDPSSQVRLASLRALQTLNTGDLGGLMQLALADKDGSVRRAALAILPGLSIPAAAKVQHLTGLMKDGSTLEKQGALEVLGALKTPESRQALGGYLDDLAGGRLAPELRVDLLDAAQTDASPALTKRLEDYQKAQNADSIVAAFREGLVRGGDARRGRQVAFENPAAECTRCHSVYGRGADVGPDLTRIGSALTREQLLEALIAPNARIAPGFGTLSVTLKNGQKVDGTLRSETDSELVVLAGTPAVEQRVNKSEIAERSNPVSAMPPLGLILKPREVRDLVEFLSMLR